jgi:hypothetical protein
MNYTTGEIDVLLEVSFVQSDKIDWGRTGVVTIDVDSNPLVNTTLLFMALASTTCPPVTLAYEAFINAVGMNIDVFVKTEAGYVPFRTW